jgi:hypothetical protein
MARWVSFPSRAVSLSACVLAVMLWMVALARAQQITADWQQPVRAKADAHQLDAALTPRRSAHSTGPQRSRGSWLRGRLLAWQGRWSQDDHFSILATNSGQLQIERIDFLGALITHEQGSIVGS